MIRNTVWKPAEQTTCLGFYTLKPYETKPVQFELNQAAPVVRTDIILITSPILKKINILPTRTELEFDKQKDCYIATALVSENVRWKLFEMVI